MPFSLTSATVVATNAVFLLAVLVYGFMPQRRLILVSPRKLSLFRPGFYLPVERLFSPADFEYVAARRSACTPAAARLRRRRTAVYHRYLGYLASDYLMLASAVKIWVVAAASDRPDLAMDLLKSRLRFGFEVIAMEVRLVLFRFGLGQVDVRPLLEALDGVRAGVTEHPSARLVAFA